MEYILIVVFAGLTTFLLVLIYYDISPKEASYKILGRFVEPPESLRPVVTDAPYRRIRPASKLLHRPILLNLETSDGSGQAVHPDVVYVPGGFGSKKWTYWLVCTPYPYGNSHYENPEVFASYDGIEWVVPDGLRNPIVGPLAAEVDHHSDGDILFHENALWIFYRETIRSKVPRVDKIYLVKSVDGTSWSVPVEILSDSKGAQLLSPAVIHDGTCFLMWTVEIQGSQFQIVRRTSSDGLRWSSAETCKAPGLEEGRNLWHIDVLKEPARLSAALVSCTESNGGGARIHYAHSLDGGLTWQVGDFLFEQVYEFESQLQYRGTLRLCDEAGRTYQLWYSAASSTNMFSIGYLQLSREGDRLFPTSCERS